MVQWHSLLVAIVAGQQWLGLDAATGRLKAGPFDLTSSPATPIKHADLDGDGPPEILMIVASGKSVAAFSTTTGQQLWIAPVDAMYDQSDYDQGPPPDWPHAVDLDRDGRSEIVVPDTGAMPPLAGYRGVRCLKAPPARHDGFGPSPDDQGRRWSNPRPRCA